MDALVLTGGGARGAYQAGVVAGLARRFPGLRMPVLSGVSAGAVNAAFLAANPSSFGEAARGLAGLWSGLTTDQVFRVDLPSLGRHVLGWGARLISGGQNWGGQVRGLLDTAPLRRLLERALAPKGGLAAGIDDSIRRGTLKAIAVGATNYSTGQSVVWVQGCCDLQPWTRPKRVGLPARLAVDHIMASTALPLFFPAVRAVDGWYGDGGIGLSTPLSPAIHLGARRILAVSTRYEPTPTEAGAPAISGYPPPAQVMGAMLNAIFLDALDEDALRLRRLNELIGRVQEDRRDGLRAVKLLVLRPSHDLGRLAAEYEPRLPIGFRFLTRGPRDARDAEPRRPQPAAVPARRLIEMGEADVEARAEEVARFLEG